MSTIWYKVWFDLWHNKTRTLLAVLSIAAGVFAVGAMFGLTDLLTTNLDKSHQSTVPPHLSIALIGFVDRDTLLDLRNVPGVEDVDPYTEIGIRYKVNPNADWRPGVIHSRDFTDQKYELVQLREGQWPQKGQVGIERMAASFLNAGVGDKLTIKYDEKEWTYPITTKIRHPFVPPPQIMDMAFFFMNGESLERFGFPDGEYNSFFVRVTPYSPDYAKEVATAIKDRLASQDIRVFSIVYQDPQKHWGRSVFDGINLVLQLLASISVLMSAVLVYNTLSNLITQQTNQIGIIKAIGGRTGTIFEIYLASALIYGLLALVLSVPLGALLAFAITQAFLGLFNIDYNAFEVSRSALGFQAASALLVPLLAGFVPTLQGARITVRQAIASYGLGSDFGSNVLDRVVERIGARLLPAHYATALGDMFRRKGRLVLTQLVLVIAGASFLIVMSLNSSITLTMDRIFARNHYDTTLQFPDNVRVDRVVPLAESVPGVEKATLQFVQSASLLVQGQLVKEAGIGATIDGIPTGSNFYTPFMVGGRWFQPGDGNVIVLSRETAVKNGIKIGDTVTLDLGVLGKGRWQVVGLYDPVFAGAFSGETIFAPQEALYAATKKANQGTILRVRTADHSAENTTRVTTALKNLFESRNIKISGTQTQADLRKTNDFQFGIVTSMLLALAIVVAIVGGIALMGTLSIAVVERTKEIGVLRAVGARSRTIMGIFVMEGVLQGLLSFLIAVPLSFVLAKPAADGMGRTMFSASLDYSYDWSAVGIWLLVILAISVIASALPARSATRVSVRESLAYA